MTRPTLTFPCPFCGRRMGVGPDLLGKQVRCPHCKQIVLAPTSPMKPTPQEPSPAFPLHGLHDLPTPISPPPTPPQPVPTIYIPQKESAESILSEPDESEDAVFGSSSNKKAPGLEQQDFSPDAPTQVSESVVPRQRTVTDETAKLQSYGSEAKPLATTTPPSVVPLGPISSEPWTNLDFTELTPDTDKEPTPTLHRDQNAGSSLDTEHDRVDQPRKSRTDSRRYQLTTILLVIISVYAVVMTGLAIYGLFLHTSSQLPPEHPLSTIPDTFGEFEPAVRKKVTQYRFPIDGDLPQELRTHLGGKLEVGQLVIEPTKVEVRPLRIVTEARAGSLESILPPALVLSLRVTNNSPSDPVHPLDPAFTRRATRDDPHPAFRLIVDPQKRPFYGGAIEWPFGSNITRKYEVAQVSDPVVLKPGEIREYVVFSDADPAIIDAVQRTGKPLLWRIQVRRGRIENRGREIPVTAIIGVEFQRDQIHNLH